MPLQLLNPDAINSGAPSKILASFVFLICTITASSQVSRVDSLINLYTQNNLPPINLVNNVVQLKGFITNSDKNYVQEEVEKAIEKYPITFLLSQVEKVDVSRFVLNKKNKLPGYAFDKTIYIAAKKNYEIEKTFHQQFALLLLNKYPLYLDMNTWMKFRDQTVMQKFHTKTLRLNSRKIDPSVNFDNGYLANAGMLNVESDFTSYAENLFAGGKQFWTLVDSYPIIKQKTLLAISFYHQIYPIFTENWFRFLAEYRLF